MATRPKSDAARAETNDEPRTIEFRGLELQLPKDLPGAAIFDIADFEKAKGPGPLIRLLGSLLGDDNLDLVRAKVAEDKVPFDEVAVVLYDLLGDVLGGYGMSPGESAASPTS